MTLQFVWNKHSFWPKQHSSVMLWRGKYGALQEGTHCECLVEGHTDAGSLIIACGLWTYNLSVTSVDLQPLDYNTLNIRTLSTKSLNLKTCFSSKLSLVLSQEVLSDLISKGVSAVSQMFLLKWRTEIEKQQTSKNSYFIKKKTIIMASWQPMSKPTRWKFDLILCQVVMTKIYWQVIVLWFMSRCHNKDILNNVIYAFKMSLLSKSHS